MTDTYAAVAARLRKEYEEVAELEGNAGFLVKKGGRWIVLDAQGKEVKW